MRGASDNGWAVPVRPGGNARGAGLLRRAAWGVCALLLVVALLRPAAGRGAEVMPPAPAHYFNDYAHVVDQGTAQQINSELEEFEKETSNQIVIAIFPKMQTDSSVDDYCYRIFHSWGVGQKGKNNGAVLFIFTAEHKIWITTGYGLEGALPDVTCQSIIDSQITPRFKQGDFGGGVRAGVDAMIAATKGEYKGTGRTVHQGKQEEQSTLGALLPFIIILILVIISSLRQRRGVMYGSGGSGFYSGFLLGGGGGGWGSGGGGGGFSGGGDGGGFSGGGGDSGGGGAGGSW